MDDTTTIYSGQPLTLEKMDALLKEIKKEYPSPRFDEFRMSRRNYEKLKDCVSPLTANPTAVQRLSGVLVTVDDEISDDLVELCLGAKVVGKIELGKVR